MPASRRVSASERFHGQVDELFGSGRELGQILEEVARLGVALLFQTAIEAEVTEFLGRERYARGERAREGLRNGYSPITVKTTAGPITIERPKLRSTEEPFTSRLLGIGVTRTKALESLVIATFVRGLSVRDVEATLDEALGDQAALSKSTVSDICQALVHQFEVWRKRDLSVASAGRSRHTAVASDPAVPAGERTLVMVRPAQRLFVSHGAQPLPRGGPPWRSAPIATNESPIIRLPEGTRSRWLV